MGIEGCRREKRILIVKNSVLEEFYTGEWVIEGKYPENPVTPLSP